MAGFRLGRGPCLVEARAELPFRFAHVVHQRDPVLRGPARPRRWWSWRFRSLVDRVVAAAVVRYSRSGRFHGRRHAYPAMRVKDVAAAAAPRDAPGVIRTRGQQFRKLLLYPSELRGRVVPDAAGRSAGRYLVTHWTAERESPPRRPHVERCLPPGEDVRQPPPGASPVPPARRSPGGSSSPPLPRPGSGPVGRRPGRYLLSPARRPRSGHGRARAGHPGGTRASPSRTRGRPEAPLGRRPTGPDPGRGSGGLELSPGDRRVGDWRSSRGRWHTSSPGDRQLNGDLPRRAFALWSNGLPYRPAERPAASGRTRPRSSDG